jgi:iron complex outermembrane receptor protein
VPPVFFWSNAWAQSDSTSNGGIETITVSAEKRPEDIQKVGMSISAFSGDDLQKLNANSVADLAPFVPNLQISPSNNNHNTEILIRGVGTGGTNAGTEPDVGVYVDGIYIPMSGPILGEVTDISTVEVLRGPQGTLYGRNTPVGAINVTTRAPTQDTEGMVDLQAGNYGELRTTGYFGGGLTDDMAGRLVFWEDTNSGYLKNIYTDSMVDSETQYGGRGRIRWTPDSQTTVDLIGYYSRTNSINDGMMQINPLGIGGIVYGYNPKPTSFATSPFVVAQKATNPAHPYVVPGKWEVDSADPAPDTTTVWGASISVSRDIPALGATLTDNLSYNSYLDFAPNQGPGGLPLDLAENLQRELVNSTANELRLTSDGTNRIDYVAGLYLFHDDLNYEADLQVGTQANRTYPASTGGGGHTNVGDDATTLFDQQTNSAAAYGQATLHITDALRALGGLRYSYDYKSAGVDTVDSNKGLGTVSNVWLSLQPPGGAAGKRDDGSLTYMYGLQYDLAPGIMSYATVSTGFKDGGYNSRSASTASFGFNPETSLNYEVGAKTEWLDDKLIVNVDVYRMLVHGYQQSTLLPSGSGFMVGNAGNFRLQGVEWDAQARPLEELSLNLSGSYNESLITGGAEHLSCDTSYPYAGSPPPSSSGPYYDGVDSNQGCNFDGLGLPGAPKWQGSIGGRWEQQWRKSSFDWFIAGNMNVVSKAYWDPSMDPRALQGGYALFDARVGLEAESGTWLVSLWGKNLTDRKYLISDNPQTQAGSVSAGGTKAINGFAGWVGLPRTIGVEASYHF